MEIIASFKPTKGCENWKWANEDEEYKKTREDYGIFFLEYGYQKKRGRVLIVEEMESAESGKHFWAKNPDYIVYFLQPAPTA